MNITLGDCKIPFSSLRDGKPFLHKPQTRFSTPASYPWHRGREMDTHCRGEGRTKEEISLASKQKAKLQQELQEQRAVEGPAQTPAGAPVQGRCFHTACTSDLTDGAAAACKTCCAKKAGNQGSPRAALSPGSCATAAAEPARLPATAVHVLGCSSLDHRGDFRAEKCSFPSNNHRRRDLPIHTSSLSQVQTEDTRHLHGAE